jgi:hypothetical protein
MKNEFLKFSYKQKHSIDSAYVMMIIFIRRKKNFYSAFLGFFGN